MHHSIIIELNKHLNTLGIDKALPVYSVTAVCSIPTQTTASGQNQSTSGDGTPGH